MILKICTHILCGSICGQVKADAVSHSFESEQASLEKSFTIFEPQTTLEFVSVSEDMNRIDLRLGVMFDNDNTLFDLVPAVVVVLKDVFDHL